TSLVATTRRCTTPSAKTALASWPSLTSNPWKSPSTSVPAFPTADGQAACASCRSRARASQATQSRLASPAHQEYNTVSLDLPPDIRSAVQVPGRTCQIRLTVNTAPTATNASFYV